MTKILIEGSTIFGDATNAVDNGDFYTLPPAQEHYYKSLGFAIVDTGAALPADFATSVYTWNGSAIVRSGDDPYVFKTTQVAYLAQVDAIFNSKVSSLSYDFGTNTAVFADGTSGPAGVQSLGVRDYTDNTTHDLTNWIIDFLACMTYVSANQGTEPVQFTAENNATITMPASTGLACLQAMLTRGKTLVFFSRALKNSILQQTTIAEIETVFNNANWPV